MIHELPLQLTKTSFLTKTCHITEQTICSAGSLNKCSCYFLIILQNTGLNLTMQCLFIHSFKLRNCSDLNECDIHSTKMRTNGDLTAEEIQSNKC